MLDKNNQNSEINLNLKMPPEQAEGDFIKDLVLTIYKARKVFFSWCCIGLIAGLIAAGAYYAKGSGTESVGEVTNSLTLNYPGAEDALLPNGMNFDIMFFNNAQLWDNALKTAELTDITYVDAMSVVNIARYTPQTDADNQAAVTSLGSRLENTRFIFTVSPGSEVFSSTGDKVMFLKALCEEFKNYMNTSYFSDGNVGLLYNQKIRDWENIALPIRLDVFSYEMNFTALSEKYTDIIEQLELLYNQEPLYKSAEEMSFNDYAEELRNIRDDDIRQWIGKLKENIYIRNVDRFKSEYQFQTELIKLDRDYSLELVASYNDLLSSFQQNTLRENVGDAPEAVAILNEAKNHAVLAADYQKIISQMEYNNRALEENETLIRANAREAEDALLSFVDGLSQSTEKLTAAIYDYYKHTNETNSKTSVVYTTPAVTEQTTSVSTTRILLIFAGLTFVGFAIGFCTAFVKKYLPEKKK